MFIKALYACTNVIHQLLVIGMETLNIGNWNPECNLLNMFICGKCIVSLASFLKFGWHVLIAVGYTP